MKKGALMAMNHTVNHPLKDKLCLVTGASAGIGVACARLLAQAGARVVAVARRKERLQKLASEFPNIEICALDITRDLSPLRKILSDRPVDVLVNNAGLAFGRETIDQTSRDDWEVMIDTNIKALVSTTQLVLPQMIQAGSGDIVNLGSIAGFRVYPGGSVYCATKFAVAGLTEAWRYDLMGKGIRVIGIHPGMVNSEFSEVRFKGDKEKAKKVYEGFDPLTPEDVAESILWVLSRPRHVNIQSLVIMPTAQAGVGAVHRRH